ncbi:MAG: antitoxin [Actinomycetaceae bacterium]|nr:antitoxin [Actinomycetaceae bacterium]MDY6083363.1 antitoxin [Actinomycetaceae bacterium]
MTDTIDQMRSRVYSEGLYQMSEVDQIMKFPRRTTAYWASSLHNSMPIISRVDAERRDPSIPFVGLAEASVLQGFKKTGVSMRRIRPAFEVLREKLGIAHILLSRRLYTDGAEILYEYAEHEDGEARKLLVARNGQQVITPIIEPFLNRIQFSDGSEIPERIMLDELYGGVSVFVDPLMNAGMPTLAENGMRVDDVIGYLTAGDDMDTIASEFGINTETVRSLALAA